MACVMRKVLSTRKEVRGRTTLLMVKQYQPSQHDGGDIPERSYHSDAGDGEPVYPGEGQGSKGANVGAIEDIYETDDDSF